MNRLPWIVFAIATFAITGAALVNTRGLAGTKNRPATSNSSQTDGPFETHSGQVLQVPAAIPLQWSERWGYSPDGTRLAIPALGSVWVWRISNNQVRQLSATADDGQHGSAFSSVFWTDDRRILAMETQNSLAEAAAWSADHASPMPAIEHRWVLLDSETGDRIRCVNDATRLEVVGVENADVWYIKAADGKLRTYDSLTGTVGSQSYFDYNAGHGYAAQVGTGSPWFSALVSQGPGNSAGSQGRLDVFNIGTGQSRSVPNVRLSVPPAIVTQNGRYLFTASLGQDGASVPEVHVVGDIQIPVPPGERWIPYCVSAARGVLLVAIPRPTSAPNQYDWHYAEVPLSELLDL